MFAESAKLHATRALVPYVPPVLRAFVPHVPCALRALVSRDLPALVPYVSRTLHALVSYVPRILRPLLSHVLCALRALVPHLSDVLLYLKCLVACVFSWCLCFVPYFFFCLSSLTCVRCFKPNILTFIWCLVAVLELLECFIAWTKANHCDMPFFKKGTPLQWFFVWEI